MIDHLVAVRERGMRSFRRLENALKELIEAVRNSAHIVSPDVSPPAT
jgi:hypothetical protein